MSNIVIPDGGNIGSASDTDAISIPANGKPTFSAGIANTGTIDAGTIGTGVTINAGSNVSGIGQLVGISFNSNSQSGETTVTVENSKTYIGLFWAYSSNAGAPEIYRFTVDGSGSVSQNRFRDWSGSLVVNFGTNTITADVSSTYEYATLIIYEEGKTVDLT